MRRKKEMNLETKTSEVNPHVTIVDLKGRLDVHYSTEIEEGLNQLINGGRIFILLNLKAVEYLSSSGLRIFIATMRKLKEKNGKLKLCNMSDAVKKIFRVVELIDMFEIYEDEQQAAQSFK